MKHLFIPVFCIVYLSCSVKLSVPYLKGQRNYYNTKQSDTSSKNKYDKLDTISNEANLYIKFYNSEQKVIPDSFQILIDKQKYLSVKNFNDSIKIKASKLRLGLRLIEIKAFKSGKTDSIKSQFVYIKNTVTPKIYKYTIVGEYPHDRHAYTQGLFFYNGYLYECTGLYEKSSLRRTKLTDGIPLNIISLPKNVFGEGISLFDGKIIQVTWLENVGYIYDIESLKRLYNINLPGLIKECWGVTCNGNDIIMSDGSNDLYFLNKSDFSIKYRIEVFDNNGPVTKINELEFINGCIWANIYNSDTVIMINPETGAVVSKVNMAGLLKPEDINSETNVLNGLAFDSVQKRIFITGKNWPKLFEISLNEKD